MSKSKLGWILLSGASIAAMGALSPAVAQDDVSEEIVVTATGRAAAIQDVPIAVTAVTGETVQNAGVENLLDMQQLAPSLRIGSGQSTSLGTTARIRALGTGSDNPGFESSVGFFIDGVYRARAGIAISDLPEVDRIEVLRGPQGTLFGKNTSSGAISIVTAGPDPDLGMWIEGGAGDLNYGAMRAGVNVPLADNFAIRVDGSVRARDGFMTDPLTGGDYNTQNRWSARAQALWDINDDASLRVIVDSAETDEDCCAATIYRYGSTQAILDSSYLGLAGGYAAFLPSFGTPGTANLPNTGYVVNAPDARQVNVTPWRDYLEQVDEDGQSAQLDWDIGNTHLTSITSHRQWDNARGQDIDFSSVDLFYRDGLQTSIETFTQEIRLQGEVGRVNWLVGAFYSDEDVDTTDRIRYGDDASDYANAVVFARTAGLGSAREMFDLTSAFVDTNVFSGNDPVPSLLGALNAGFDQTYLPRFNSGDGQVADNWKQSSRDISVFTHNEVNLTDDLVLTVGARYNQNTKDITANLDAQNGTCDNMQTLNAGFGLFTGLNAAANGAPSPAQAQAFGLRTLFALACAPQGNTAADGVWTGSRDEDAWSGTASLSYHLTPDLMVYGGYARGYKAGGYNLDRSGFTALFPGMTVAQAQAQLNTDQLSFNPETTDSFEIGVRSTLFGGSTYFNVTAFYTELQDYQLNAFNGTAFITKNLPLAISQGVEIDLLTRPMEGLTFQGGLNYTDAYNDETVSFVANSAADTVFAGDPLVQAPEWSLTGSVTYELPISDSLRALFYLDARYDTEYRTQALGRDPISDQPDTLTVNGRIGLGSPTGHWNLEVWGRNLTDEFIAGGFNAPLQSGTIGAFTNEPQTYGVTLRARY